MEDTVQPNQSERKGAFRAVRSANQRYALQHTLNFNDIRHVAADLGELMRRFNKVRALGGRFAQIELSPYVGRMIKIVGAEKLSEQLLPKV